MNSAHDERVLAVAEAIRKKRARNEKTYIQKGGVSHFVPLPADRRATDRPTTKPIDISNLNHILEINAVEKTCTAEPGVTFKTLVHETLKHGLLPCVVPELEGISLGGAVAGCSVESMSYRYGGFHDSCLEYEILTAEGEILTCSPESESLLFEMIHGSYGTLGILSRIKFRLVPAKAYVRMEYRHFRVFSEFEKAMREECRSARFDFIDGIIHSPVHLVLCLGSFREQAPYVHSYRKTHVFYKSTRKLQRDFMTTEDYCFRYDADCHWLTRTFPPLEWGPIRYLLGRWVLGSTNLIRWSKRLERILALKKRPDVVCDVFIPAAQFSIFFDWYSQVFSYFPLWVVPYRIPKKYGWIREEYATAMGEDLFIDCAIYGKPNNEPQVDYSKLLEDKTFELGGIKTLISRNHYSRERFWTIYNEKNYRLVKSKTDPEGFFRDLYEKFHSDS